MTDADRYSGADYWDDYHATSARSGSTRRTQERIWLTGFLPVLAGHSVRSVLDLGCGSGADAIALARLGYETTGVDISTEAIALARSQAEGQGLPLRFEAHDIAKPLPFADASFDAVISNLTLHMFPENLARNIIIEVARCLGLGGLFLFHVNSTADMPHRLARQPPVARLGPRFYRLGKGQTMRFFDEDDCRALVSGWRVRRLEHIESRLPDGAVRKCAWRCIAEKV